MSDEDKLPLDVEQIIVIIEKMGARIISLEEKLRQRDIDDDEAVRLAHEKGISFALDYIGYDGLANLIVEERRKVTSTS